jgi:hypothetical protein
MDLDLIPLLEKNYSEKNSKQLYDAKISLMHYVVALLPQEAQERTLHYIHQLYEQDKKIVEIGIRVPSRKTHNSWSIQKKRVECSDKSTCIVKGAGWGGFFGCTLGGNTAGGYYIADGCINCCCSNTISFTPIALMNKIMCYTLLTCTCVGCVIGACCVTTGCSEPIDVIFE